MKNILWCADRTSSVLNNFNDLYNNVSNWKKVMYSIEKKPYGLKLTFGGAPDRDEVAKWVLEMKNALEHLDEGFSVFVDMRSLIPLDKECQELLGEGQVASRNKGMLRSVVILSSPVITMQFKAIAGQTGIFAGERYIDSSSEPDWENKGLMWLLHSQEPIEETFDEVKSS